MESQKQRTSKIHKELEEKRKHLHNLTNEQKNDSVILDHVLKNRPKEMAPLTPENMEMKIKVIHDKIEIFAKTRNELLELIDKLKKGEYGNLDTKEIYAEVGVILSDINSFMPRIHQFAEQIIDLGQNVCDHELRAKKRKTNKDDVKTEESTETSVAIKSE